MPIKARAALCKAAQHALDTHTGVDYHWNCADFEHGKGKDKEFEARFDHQDGTDTSFDTGIIQPAGNAVRFLVQLLKIQLGISDPARFVTAQRCDHSPFIRLPGRHFTQVGRHIDGGDTV